MKIIWKYILETKDKQIIPMPQDYEFLTIQIQNEKPCLWVMVNQDYLVKDCTIEIIGTGHKVNDEPRKYIGTYQLLGGQLVFHVFQNLLHGELTSSRW